MAITKNEVNSFNLVKIISQIENEIDNRVRGSLSTTGVVSFTSEVDFNDYLLSDEDQNLIKQELRLRYIAAGWNACEFNFLRAPEMGQYSIRFNL